MVETEFNKSWCGRDHGTFLWLMGLLHWREKKYGVRWKRIRFLCSNEEKIPSDINFKFLFSSIWCLTTRRVLFFCASLMVSEWRRRTIIVLYATRVEKVKADGNVHYFAVLFGQCSRDSVKIWATFRWKLGFCVSYCCSLLIPTRLFVGFDTLFCLYIPLFPPHLNNISWVILLMTYTKSCISQVCSDAFLWYISHRIPLLTLLNHLTISRFFESYFL